VKYLVDTNVISELRKGERVDPGVRAWFDELSVAQIFLSVLSLGELRRGVELIRRRDPVAAQSLASWLDGLGGTYADRILPVNQEIADTWGRLNVPDPLSVVDGLLAATAIVHGLTLATRNIEDVQRTGVACVNPFG
jgi:hypothetical protein